MLVRVGLALLAVTMLASEPSPVAAQSSAAGALSPLFRARVAILGAADPSPGACPTQVSIQVTLGPVRPPFGLRYRIDTSDGRSSEHTTFFREPGAQPGHVPRAGDVSKRITHSITHGDFSGWARIEIRGTAIRSERVNFSVECHDLRIALLQAVDGDHPRFRSMMFLPLLRNTGQRDFSAPIQTRVDAHWGGGDATMQHPSALYTVRPQQYFAYPRGPMLLRSSVGSSAYDVTVTQTVADRSPTDFVRPSVMSVRFRCVLPDVDFLSVSSAHCVPVP
jgi:hypothetical protein